MGVVYQRHLGPVESLLPKQWTAETASGKPAICCEQCGGVTDIDEDEGVYTILDAGRVVPIFSCPWTTCPSMDWINLESYERNP